MKYYSQFADVMVTARELNINQVRHITEEIERRNITGPGGDLVRIEVFCHGALCMAVSGKCYLSLDNFGTSANRGACVQPCRRGYEVTDRDKEITLAIENEYIMSPKDLCTLPFLDKVLASGVKVLKIEGRGRSPEYTKLTVSVYREAVDAVRNGTFDEEKVAAWLARLKSVYNRDFWDGYYLGRKMGEWTTKYGSQATKTKLFVGTVTNFFGKISVAEIRMETHDIKLGDEIMIIGPSTGVYEDTVREIRVDLNPVEMSVKGELCSIPTNDTVRRGDKVYKIIDANQDNATL